MGAVSPLLPLAYLPGLCRWADHDARRGMRPAIIATGALLLALRLLHAAGAIPAIA
jgi:hypothetical protein